MEIQKKKLQQSRSTFLDEKRRNFRGIVSSKHVGPQPRPTTLQNGRVRSRERSNTFESVMNGKVKDTK